MTHTTPERAEAEAKAQKLASQLAACTTLGKFFPVSWETDIAATILSAHHAGRIAGLREAAEVLDELGDSRGFLLALAESLEKEHE